jgi:hypothetical protein
MKYTAKKTTFKDVPIGRCFWCNHWAVGFMSLRKKKISMTFAEFRSYSGHKSNERFPANFPVFIRVREKGKK